MNPESMTYDELFKYIIDPYLNSMSSEALVTRALSVLYDKTQDKIESEIYQVEKGLDEDTVLNLEWEVEHLNMQINNLQEKIKNSFDENGVYVGDAIKEAKEKEKELNTTIVQFFLFFRYFPTYLS